jgi:hypothetical protein
MRFSQKATKVNEEKPFGEKTRFTVRHPHGETVQSHPVFVSSSFLVIFVCFCETQLPDLG